jgi:hypothetical protein
VLLSPRFRDSRWHSTKLPDAAVRAFGYRLVLQVDPDRSEEVFRIACAIPKLHFGVSATSVRFWIPEESLKLLGVRFGTETLPFERRL